MIRLPNWFNLNRLIGKQAQFKLFWQNRGVIKTCLANKPFLIGFIFEGIKI
jgi:hypothetical protein